MDKVLEAVDTEEDGDSGTDYERERGFVSGVVGCYQIDPNLYREGQHDFITIIVQLIVCSLRDMQLKTEDTNDLLIQQFYFRCKSK